MPQRITRQILIPCLIASAAVTLQAQSPVTHVANLPRFEIVSVRPSNMAERGAIDIKADADGKVRLTHLPLLILLVVAFDLRPDSIIGVPPAMMKEQFDITGVPPGNHAGTVQNERSVQSPLTKEQRLMLQAVLVDRFHLRSHDSSVEGKVLELRTGKGTLKLTPAKDTTAFPFVGGSGATGLTGRNASMDLVASTLSQFLGTPVINKTGLNGTFDFNHAPEDSTAASDDIDFSATTVASVRALGFDLKPSTGAIQTLVIDHLEQPSPN